MATLDLLTEQEAMRAALGSDTVAHEAEIRRMTTAVSLRIDELVGPVVNRTVTEYHDGGQAAIWPRQTPVSSVTTLRHWDGTTTTTYTQDTWGGSNNDNGFMVEKSGSYAHDARIHRRSSGTNTLWPTGHRSIELVYVAGRAADTDSVDARFKECAAAILRRLWKRESPMWSQSSNVLATINAEGATPGGSPFFRAIDPMISEFLRDEMKPPAVA